MELSDPHVVAAVTYCRAIVAGEISASTLTVSACKRQLDDLERWATDPTYPFEFDERLAGRPCRFIEQLPHVKGPKANAGERIRLEPWQCFVVTTLYGWIKKETKRRRFRRAYIEVARGNAKALDIDTPIPTPDGWRLMGDLAVGDRVFDETGQQCTVVAATDTMWDRPCFELEFSTGERIVADADHQWLTVARVHSPARRSRRGIRHGCGAGGGPRIRTTAQIFETQTYGIRGDRNHMVSVAAPVVMPQRDLPVPPYVLGAWLGDGNSGSARFTCAYRDIEIVEQIRAEGIGAVECPSPNANAGLFCLGSFGRRHADKSLQRKLRLLGVLRNKHIPAIYLRGSIPQRLALLQGLMDTDGSITKSQGQCSFANTKHVLATGVHELAASLGLRPTIREERARLHGQDVGPVWRVTFHAYEDTPVFRLSRKLAQQRRRPSARGLQTTRAISAVRPVVSRPVRCIEVDSPSRLYLAGRGFIPTHNSTLLSGLALYALAADGEEGAEVVSAATTRDQARIVFGVAQAMLRKRPELASKLGLANGNHAIVKASTASRFFPLSREANNQDGLNVHLAVVDELHAHRTREIYDVLETALGKRDQSMLVVITTAGTDTSGICYEVRTYCTKLLQGSYEDESQFAAVWTCDPEDDWTAPEVWRKANPNWGVSVQPDVIEGLAKKAIELASAQNNFKTKHLDLWCNADTSWMNMVSWDACADPSLAIEDFAGEDCWIGFDLASRSDLAARALLFGRNLESDGKIERHWYLFVHSYLPEETVEGSSNASYEGWAREGWIKTTPGSVLDFSVLRDDTLLDRDRFRLRECPFDPWQATQLASELLAEDVPMVEYRNTVMQMSQPMKELEALVLAKRLHHNADPCLRWQISNVVCHRDKLDNIRPNKSRHELKIDGPVASIMAIGRALLSDAEPDPYLSGRGIRVIG